MSLILGPDGQPIAAALQPQTSRVAQIAQRWAGHPVRGLTPARLAQILADAEQGMVRDQAELWADIMERDPHVCAELGKLRRSISRLAWTIEAPERATPEESMAAERCQTLLRALPMRRIQFDLLDAIGAGYSCAELHPWTRTPEGWWFPTRALYREQRLFRLHQPNESLDWEVRLDDHSLHGQPLRPYGWIVHVSCARSGPLTRIALLRSLVWPFMFKTFSLSDWAEFLEVYGYPIRVGTYHAGATDTDRRTLMRAVVEIGRQAGGIVPSGMDIKLLDAVDGDPKAFRELVEWAEKCQSKAIHGGTLTSQADGATSTNALGQVHEDARLEGRDYHAADLADTLTEHLVWPICKLNGWIRERSRCPQLRHDLDQADDVKLYADALPLLAAGGMEIPLDWVHDRLRIPKAEPGKAIFRARSGAPATAFSGVGCAHGSPDPAPRAVARGLNAVKRYSMAAAPSDPDDPADVGLPAVVDQLQAEAAAAHRDVIEHLRAMVEQAKDLETLRDDLLAAYGQLPMDGLRRVMEAGFALASLQGVVAASRDSGE